MHFNTKSYIKSNRNHTAKHTLSRFCTNTQAAMGWRDDKTTTITLNKIFIVFLLLFSGFSVFFLIFDNKILPSALVDKQKGMPLVD